MLHDAVANSCWMKFIEAFKKYQLMIMHETQNEILAVINSVPIRYEGEISDLPDEGWDWGVDKSIKDLEAGNKPNFLMGVQIVVNRNHQGEGLSRIAVEEMSLLARNNGFKKLIIPVRPSGKHNYPLVSMREYIGWANEKGLPSDNWLRVHVRAGGKIIKICPEAMRIVGSSFEWKEWTGIEFTETGSFTVPGALKQVAFSKEKDQAVYTEPNVWVLHDADEETHML